MLSLDQVPDFLIFISRNYVMVKTRNEGDSATSAEPSYSQCYRKQVWLPSLICLERLMQREVKMVLP